MKAPRDVVTRAATFYERNHRAWLGGEFAPLTISLQPPSGRAAELDDGQSTKTWLKQWSTSTIPVHREQRKLGYLGTYDLPMRVVLDSPETAAAVAGKAQHWQRINELMDRFTAELGVSVRAPLVEKLTAWQGWKDITAEQFIDVIRWFRSHDSREYYIRELPILGVDTKWIDRNRTVVTAVVGELLFREKPVMIQLRSLDDSLTIHGLSHLSCEPQNLGVLPGQRVVFVENYMTFLALPPIAGAVAIYGGGLQAHSIAAQLPGLADKEIFYWGDIDTHGFYILDLVRRKLPHTRSVLMDLHTARIHELMAVEEPTPKRFQPQHLTPAEVETLEFLWERSATSALRIEQERISFDHVNRVLGAL
ncbi:hypothetical protein J5O04_01165 [Corynebacterium hindlerae]|uniref:Wadjet anti-phage system protein JetD domain-containing protein n=1 Tax=Corynebacterium hindlerae TaxID=699041 RepID=UPI001AD6C135|nr:Wadjet anti-phage system protein JetD domain-containing protein [Corynebacterium hindlerae]QTH59786.1 hypothetical protein J5O04_01165 [Corynebacterium hindlerae]